MTKQNIIGYCKVSAFFAMLAVWCFLLSSCVYAEQKCYNDFCTFVKTVEEKASNYTAQDWEVCSQVYDRYTKDLDAYSQLYTPEQNREIGQLKARYHKLILKYTLNRAANYVTNLSYQMEGYVEEMENSEDEHSLFSDEERVCQEIDDAIESITYLFEE